MNLLVWFPFLSKIALRRGILFGGILLTALFAFEVFNASSTHFALYDILKDRSIFGMRWDYIGTVFFCCIDFLGISRIFTPEKGRDEPAAVWYIFGAWLLFAGLNATLTWWGVSVAILQNTPISVNPPDSMLTTILPVFVAGMVLLVRVLLINSFSIAGDRLFSFAEPAKRTN